MSLKGVPGLLALVVSLLLCSYAVEGDTLQLSAEEEMEIERELKSFNKPYVKSFKDEYGITYDCIDAYKQPAFDHPLLKNHTLQTRFTSLSRGPETKLSAGQKKSSFGLKESCPEGTVLIRRIAKEDLISARKYAQKMDGYKPFPSEIEFKIVNKNHWATVSYKTGKGPKYYGAEAQIEVYNLPGVQFSQSSTSQIIVSKGETGSKEYFNTVQAGWNVDPRLYRDNLTHLFTYWTTDGYERTGCVNLVCRGFVQYSKSVTSGMVATPGTMHLSIYRDPYTKNWILKLDGTEIIGYWPKEIFNNMADSSQVQMGGIVFSDQRVRSPPMGNGKHPYQGSAMFTKAAVYDGTGKSQVPGKDNIKLYADLYLRFYSVVLGRDASEFYYGGPGEWVLGEKFMPTSEPPSIPYAEPPTIPYSESPSLPDSEPPSSSYSQEGDSEFAEAA